MSVSQARTTRSTRHARTRARGSAPARSREATRRALIDAGRRLFAERGLHQVTTHDIAAEAGFAAGTFYLHFKDKLALFRQITDEAVGRLEERLWSAARSEGEARFAVRAHAEALIQFAEEQRDLICILFGPGAEGAQIREEVLDRLAASVTQGRREARDSGRGLAGLDPEVSAQALIGMWSRVVAWWAADPSRASRKTVIETLVRIQTGGTHPADPD